MPFSLNPLQSALMEKLPDNNAFEEALDYLYSFINFERRPQDRYMAAKLDASRPLRFMNALGAPQDTFPSIHIAGTKGKGSVAITTAHCLRAAGYKVGLYTSPHLQDFRERIRILTPDDAGGRITETAFIQQIEALKPIIATFPDVTWFEILTAVAFRHFAQEQIDVGVIEVGLGGRLDATNVVTSLVSIITSLSIDHTRFLGDTLPQIAAEKAGIIKPGIPVITVAQKPEATAVLRRIAAEQEAPLGIIGQNWQYSSGEQFPQIGEQELIITRSPDSDFIPNGTVLRLTLSGQYQLENGVLALAALQTVRPHFPALDLTAVQTGLAHVEWHGRLQILYQGSAGPTLLADCAHNPDSAQKLCHALTHNYTYDRLWIIFGSARDKDIRREMELLLPPVTAVITTTVNHPRSATPEELAQMAADFGKPAYTVADMDTAVSLAWQQAAPQDLICVTGSIYVVGDLLNRWESLQSQLIHNEEQSIVN
ncbi:MAG: bifunctional folylpolyglutamate synthase/dihydrofolate synthase [Chloroflexi bacterium]|nr:bifunctional folylpolyglutamate synthase/dihydrofolate synthase [Chloroflexota bacterium]